MTTPAPDPSAVDEPNLTSRTLSGLKWTYGTTIVSVILQIGFTAVISRLLDDSVFGLIAIAQISLRFGGYVSELGLGKALVQKLTVSTEEIRTAHTSGTMLGLGVAGLFVAGAPAVARLFDEPDVLRPLQAMSLTMALLGVGLTATALAKRTMRFQALGLVDLASYVIGYPVVGIAAALSGLGVWSLVAAALVQAATKSVFTYALVRHPVKPLLATRAMRELYSYGGRVGVLGLLEFIGGDLDTFAISRYADTATLGQYNRGFMLLRLPLYHAVNSLTSVVFPGMSSIQHDIPRLRRAFLSLTGILAGIILPLCAGAAVASTELALVVLGPQWATTALVLPMIAAAVAVQFLTTPCGIVMEAVAALNRKLAIQVIYLAILSGFMALAAGGPVVGYAAALAAGQVIRHVMYLLTLRRVIGVRTADVLRRYAAAALVSAMVAAAIALVRMVLLRLGLPSAPVLAAEAVTGGLTVVICIRGGVYGQITRDLIARLRDAGALGGGGKGDRLAVLAIGRKALAEQPQ